MISIIICSKAPSLLKSVSKNIADTIGIPYEIIGIENHNGRYGICKAYNIGASKAKFDVLCFAHEDIHFETQNWGIKVADHLMDDSVGLIGVVGADPKSIVPSSFAQHLLKHEANIIVYANDQKSSTHVLTTCTPENKSTIKQVTAVDGVFMCTRREVYNQFQFDDVTFKGFHAYDADLSLQVLSNYKVCVIFDVLMRHYSSGHADRNYMDHKLLLCRKWKKKLPISFRTYTEAELKHHHWLAMECFLDKLIKLNYTFLFIMSRHIEFSFNRFFSLKRFLRLFKKIVVQKLM